MKITFINPPIKLGKTYAHYPLFSNLGMLQNAAVLEEKGYKVRIIDSFFITEKINYYPIEEELFHLGAEIEYLESIIKMENADIFILPITMFSDVEKLSETYFREICGIVKKYHKNSILITADCYICGMNYFAYDSEKLLKNIKEIDINLKGETEFTLPAILNHIKKNGIEDLLYGTYRFDKTIFSKTDFIHFPQDLNLLPYPAFHLLNMKNYFGILGEAARLDLIHEYHKPEKLLPLMTSRGCLFSCNFCTQQVLKMPYRFYYIEYLKKEIIYLKRKYKVDRFMFLDNNINADIERFNKLITFLADMRISWDAVNGFRADKLTKKHILKIKEAGNTKLTVSAESGDPEILNNVVNKGLNIKAVIDVAKWSYSLNFPCQVHYIIGMPGEDISKMNKTLEFAEMLYEKYSAWPLLQHAIPFRKTKLFLTCKENNYFVINPDKVSTHYLEKYPIIRTEKFTNEDVHTIKNHFTSKFKFHETTSFIIVNNSCNNSCKHCEISDSLNKKKILTSQIKKSLQIAKNRIKNHIILIGGEPSLNINNLLFAIRYAKGLGIPNISMATNGRMLIYKDFVTTIIREGINQISVSINSTSPTKHDYITSVKGSFIQTLNGIQNLLQNNFYNININIRITSVNQDELVDIIQTFVNNGIHNYYLRVAVPLGSVEKNISLLPNLKKLAETLNRNLSKYNKYNIKIVGLPFCMINQRFIHHLTFYPPLYNEQYRKLKVKISKCLNCIHYISCMGFYRPEYDTYYKQDIE